MSSKKGNLGSRARLRNHFLSNIGRIMDSEELRQVADTSEWGRRVRELRTEAPKIRRRPGGCPRFVLWLIIHPPRARGERVPGQLRQPRLARPHVRHAGFQRPVGREEEDQEDCGHAATQSSVISLKPSIAGA